MKFTRRCFFTFGLAVTAGAQTLAHPGWRGNGIAAEAWWKHTAIVRFAPDTTFAQATALMDNMSVAGVDTMLLPDLQPVPGASLPFADRFGSEDDLDALLREASARRMHVMLTAPLLRLAGNSGEVRFWLTRGIAGFDINTVRPADLDSLHLLRAALGRFPGQRILLGDLQGSFPTRAFAELQQATPSLILEFGRNDYVWDGSSAFQVNLYFRSQPIGLRQFPGIPVFESVVLDSQEQRAAARQWLAQYNKGRHE